MTQKRSSSSTRSTLQNNTELGPGVCPKSPKPTRIANSDFHSVKAGAALLNMRRIAEPVLEKGYWMRARELDLPGRRAVSSNMLDPQRRLYSRVLYRSQSMGLR